MSSATPARTRWAVAVGLMLAALTMLAACGSAGSTSGTTEPAAGSTSAGTMSAGSSSAGPATGTLTVFAAASLKKTFTEIGDLFQQQNPGVTVTFNFAGSSDLVTQITSGAPADVFASADKNNMTKAVDGGVVSGTPVDFASNTLTIATQPGNPQQVKSFADLARADLQVVVCAPQVPCGSATQRVEQNSGVTLKPVSEESSVTDVLNKVQTGQADAGLVYVTDAEGAGDKVTAVPFPEAAAAVNVYPIAALNAAAQPGLATGFVELVTGPEGQRILQDAGFAPAP
jgi:molybdate transport system substrate-binding protein